MAIFATKKVTPSTSKKGVKVSSKGKSSKKKGSRVLLTVTAVPVVVQSGVQQAQQSSHRENRQNLIHEPDNTPAKPLQHLLTRAQYISYLVKWQRTGMQNHFLNRSVIFDAISNVA